ncbi:MAG: UPF0280 family protein [Desulfobulbaceae bacterium]|nr:MAG: UPF0280 family protein [Desulfobulbaceae bacterium]
MVDAGDLVPTSVTVQETDLLILAQGDVSSQARNLILTCRSRIERYIAGHPHFAGALSPLAADPLAPAIVQKMLNAARAAGVGPMAAVAGVIAEFVGQGLLAGGVSREVMVENGGDIFLCRNRPCLSAIYAGESPLSNRIGLRIDRQKMPLGICTSSGAIGHSLSFGSADSVTVLAHDTALADTAATRLGNELKSADDMDHTLRVAQGISGLLGVVIVKNDTLGAWGDIELVKI